ncbi:RlpA-like double-psi beta-barrel-protein domain-containing protein-containing protein, partial [Sordaria brevicollis]
SGRFTYFNPGLGACGWWHGDNDLVVALNAAQFDVATPPDGNPNHNAFCGRKIKASYNGKSVTVAVVDRCPGCPWGGLDLSPAAFKKLAGLEVGVLQGTWEWV